MHQKSNTKPLPAGGHFKAVVRAGGDADDDDVFAPPSPSAAPSHPAKERPVDTSTKKNPSKSASTAPAAAGRSVPGSDVSAPSRIVLWRGAVPLDDEGDAPLSSSSIPSSKSKSKSSSSLSSSRPSLSSLPLSTAGGAGGSGGGGSVGVGGNGVASVTVTGFHATRESSYFARLWDKGKKKRRWFLIVRKV